MSRTHSPSIRMVAARAGVSVPTVSNVLNGKPNVSSDMVERVNKAVRELGYVVDIAASRLRSRKALLAGVVVPDLTNPMFATFVSTQPDALQFLVNTKLPVNNPTTTSATTILILVTSSLNISCLQIIHRLRRLRRFQN